MASFSSEQTKSVEIEEKKKKKKNRAICSPPAQTPPIFSLSVGSFYKYNSGVVTVVFFLVLVAVETIRSRGSKKYRQEAKRAKEVDRLKQETGAKIRKSKTYSFFPQKNQLKDLT
jgi:hypothetical protein